MSYTVHNFEQGDVLYANQLNEMDAQIALNEQNIDAGVSSNMLAEEYSANKTYSIGDYVMHNDALYVCIYEITAPEGWNSAHWQTSNLGAGIKNLNGEVGDLNNALNNTADNLSTISKHLIKAVSGEGLSIEKLPIFSNGVKRNQAVDVPPATDTETICTQVFRNDSESAITVNVKCDTGYVAVVVRFNTTGAYAGFKPSTYRNDISVEVEAGYYYCIEVRKDPRTDFDKTDFSPDMISISVGAASNVPMETASAALTKADEAISKALLAETAGDAVKTTKADKLSLHDISEIRRAFPRAFTEVALPSVSFLSGVGITLFSDGYNYKPIIDFDQFRNVSSNIVRVSNSSDLASALTSASSGDTIILEEGMYSALSVSKSINLIGENAMVVPSVCGEFEASAMDNVYSCALSGANDSADAYDISNLQNGIIRKLTKVSSTTALNTPGTWYGNTQRLYVHLFDNAVPTPALVFVDRSDINAITISGINENGKVYMEGITVLGGMSNVDFRGSSTYTEQLIAAKDCRFLYANSENAVTLKGVKGFFKKCEAAYAKYDGYNYHGLNDATTYLANGLEIDCVAHDNGFGNSENQSCNGSTMHNGGKAIRINGVYYHNQGGNIADITTGTETYNYGCVAFDSTAEDGDTHTNADFWAYYGSKMYLYGCRGIGSSMANLFAAGNATLYYQNTEFDTKRGNVEEIA